jgi:ketosteroid isomerase-like protein
MTGGIPVPGARFRRREPVLSRASFALFVGSALAGPVRSETPQLRPPVHPSVRHAACDDAGRAALESRFVEDMRRKAFDDVLSLYTPDAVFLDPSGKTLRGRRQLVRLYRQVFRDFDSDLRLHATSVTRVAGSACEEIGTYDEDLRTRSDGKVREFAGPYRFQARLTAGGEWKFTSMDWTSRAPRAPEPCCTGRRPQ